MREKIDFHIFFLKKKGRGRLRNVAVYIYNSNQSIIVISYHSFAHVQVVGEQCKVGVGIAATTRFDRCRRHSHQKAIRSCLLKDLLKVICFDCDWLVLFTHGLFSLLTVTSQCPFRVYWMNQDFFLFHLIFLKWYINETYFIGFNLFILFFRKTNGELFSLVDKFIVYFSIKLSPRSFFKFVLFVNTFFFSKYMVVVFVVPMQTWFRSWSKKFEI